MTSSFHVHDEMTQRAIRMSMPPGYNFVLGWSIEQRYNDSASGLSQPSKLATPNSHALIVQLVGVGVTYGARFLLAFFTFLFAKLGVGQPQWMTKMWETCWQLCFYVFCVFPTDDANVVAQSEWSVLSNSQELDRWHGQQYPSRLLKMQTTAFFVRKAIQMDCSSMLL